MKALKLFFISLLSLGFTFAQVDHFFVQVNPNTMKPNEAADLTIKALDDKGNVVKDYQGNVLIEAQGLTDKDVTIPSDGFYEFATTDAGQKTFTKGLIFKKEGDFKVNVSDLSDDKIKGSVSVSVKAKGSATNSGAVNILAPIDGSIEKSSNVNVSATTSAPNTPYQVFVDSKKFKDGVADNNGAIAVTTDSLKNGDHKVSIKTVDVDGKVLSESKTISFTVKADAGDLLKSVQVSPSTNVSKGGKATITVVTSETVSSAELSITGLGSYPMDKSQEGQFTKEVLFDKIGTFPIGVKLSSDSSNKDYSNKATVTVKEKAAVKEVKVLKNKSTQMDLEWTYVGNISKFKVMFGTGVATGAALSGNNLSGVLLSGSMLVDKAKATLTNVDPLATYFIKVIPVDASGAVAGDESQLIVVEPEMKGAATCKVKGIKISTTQEGGKYYLSWGKVENAKSYTIYRSDTETGNIGSMQKVGETQDTKFEYPFDPHSKKDMYAYYVVEANCTDGAKLQIDAMKKVKVGPLDTIIFIILLSTFMYLIYRMYYFTK